MTHIICESLILAGTEAIGHEMVSPLAIVDICHLGHRTLN